MGNEVSIKGHLYQMNIRPVVIRLWLFLRLMRPLNTKFYQKNYDDNNQLLGEGRPFEEV